MPAARSEGGCIGIAIAAWQGVGAARVGTLRLLSRLTRPAHFALCAYRQSGAIYSAVGLLTPFMRPCCSLPALHACRQAVAEPAFLDVQMRLRAWPALISAAGTLLTRASAVEARFCSQLGNLSRDPHPSHPALA